MKVTDYLAIYASVLSTIAFLWNVIQARARIKVDLLPGVEVLGPDVRHGVYVIIRNVSSHDVHLAGVDVLYKYRATRLKDQIAHLRESKRWPRTEGWVHVGLEDLSIQSGCPLRLEARRCHRLLIPNSVLDHLRPKSVGGEIMAHVQDQLWNDYYSKTLAVWKDWNRNA